MSENISYSIEVDSKVYSKIDCGEITTVIVEINEENQFELLENVKDCLLLNVENVPNTFHSCFYWNNGVFPYLINPNLKMLHISEKGPKDDILETSFGIRRITPKVGRRFNYGRKGFKKDGDSCIWQLEIELEDRPGMEHKTYIMRWNPGISSSKLEDFRKALKKWPEGFAGDWSIYEWQEAKEGDRYVMVRVGEGPNGIVYDGRFKSDPYEGEDWAGKGYTRHYVDITIEHPCDPDKPCITIEQLEEAIPEICWRRGHSGELLTKEQAEKLEKLFEGKMR